MHINSKGHNFCISLLLCVCPLFLIHRGTQVVYERRDTLLIENCPGLGTYHFSLFCILCFLVVIYCMCASARLSSLDTLCCRNVLTPLSSTGQDTLSLS